MAQRALRVSRDENVAGLASGSSRCSN